MPAESVLAAHSALPEMSAHPVSKSSSKRRLHDPPPIRKRPILARERHNSAETGDSNVRLGSHAERPQCGHRISDLPRGRALECPSTFQGSR